MPAHTYALPLPYAMPFALAHTLALSAQPSAPAPAQRPGCRRPPPAPQPSARAQPPRQRCESTLKKKTRGWDSYPPRYKRFRTEIFHFIVEKKFFSYSSL
jgi:hypothetical protein